MHACNTAGFITRYVFMKGVTLHKNEVKLVMLLASFPSQIKKMFNSKFFFLYSFGCMHARDQWDIHDTNSNTFS
jgi:hypothetical protein